MIARLVAVILAACAGALGVTDVGAQATRSSTDRVVRPFAGIALGAGTIPGALSPTCSYRLGTTPAISADARFGVRRASFLVESRTSIHADGTLEDCLFRGPSGDEGIDTVRTSPFQRGGFVVTDVRFGYTGRSAGLRWLVSGGVGWVWARNLPIVLVGSGIRLGRTVRAVLDLDLSAYRIPWEVVVAEWRNLHVVRELSRRQDTGWESAVSLRLGFEVAAGGEP